MHRVPFPADVNPEPEVRFSRNTHYRPAAGGERKMPFLAPVLAVLVCLFLLMAANSDRAPAPSKPLATEMRVATAAKKVCGPGRTAVWSDASTMQCFKDQP